MRRLIAVMLTLLILPSISSVDAENKLIEVGVIETIDGRYVGATFTSASTLLTVTKTGNLSEHFWGSGTLITQWSIELNTSVNSATLDSTGLQVAVAHSQGVYVINTESRIISGNYETSSSVDTVHWDSEGDMWYGFYGGERRAKEYRTGNLTGEQTQPHLTALTAMTIISEDRIVTGGRDNLVKVFDQDGALQKSISDFVSYPSKIVTDPSGNLIVGCSNGDIFRYNVSDWSYESTSISSSQSIISISFSEVGDILVGTQNGKLHQLESSNFSEVQSYASAGRVILGTFGSSEELYIISTFSTTSKIRLFDLDTDGDGFTDSQDSFPYDSTQNQDTDGDGFGDNEQGNNPDKFPEDSSQWDDMDGDGYGDNPDGNDSDAFPENAEQWTDTDGDGYGDNINSEGGDRFPEEPTQWSDLDSDGFGDNISGINGDDCPNQNGFSSQDRLGCKDSDGDGYSNPSENWTLADGADFAIYDKSQWVDSDGDGYGDNLQGNDPDACPLEWGNSTSAYIPEISDDGSLELNFVVKEKFGCIDTDGDGFYDLADDLPDDPRDYIDADDDSIGASQDYNDSNRLVQTVFDHCELSVTDVTEVCQGVRDANYQNYVTDKEAKGEKPKEYFAWIKSQQEVEEEADSSDQYLSTAKEIAPLLGGGFAAIVTILLILTALGRGRRRKALVKTYGVPFVPDGKNSAEVEALEGKAGLSGSGGVDSDKYWDDDVAPMDMAVGDNENEQNSGFDDIDLKGDVESSESSGVMEESSSLEELAGLPAQTTASEVSQPNVPEQQAPPEAPPLPASGLPEGWTMDQWRWYGAQWLANQGK